MVASSKKQPFPVEVVVFEEDTFMLMSAGNRVKDVPGTTDESLQEIAEFTPRNLGDLVTRGNRYFAIVHDFDNDPSFSREATGRVLARIARLSEETGIESIAIQAFGSGAVDGDHDWLRTEISRRLSAGPIKRVWLIVG